MEQETKEMWALVELAGSISRIARKVTEAEIGRRCIAIRVESIGERQRRADKVLQRQSHLRHHACR